MSLRVQEYKGEIRGPKGRADFAAGLGWGARFDSRHSVVPEHHQGCSPNKLLAEDAGVDQKGMGGVSVER